MNGEVLRRENHRLRVFWQLMTDLVLMLTKICPVTYYGKKCTEHRKSSKLTVFALISHCKSFWMNFESQKERKWFSQFGTMKKNGGIVGKNSLYKSMNESKLWEYRIRTRIYLEFWIRVPYLMAHKWWSIKSNVSFQGLHGRFVPKRISWSKTSKLL